MSRPTRVARHEAGGYTQRVRWTERLERLLDGSPPWALRVLALAVAVPAALLGLALMLGGPVLVYFLVRSAAGDWAGLAAGLAAAFGLPFAFMRLCFGENWLEASIPAVIFAILFMIAVPKFAALLERSRAMRTAPAQERAERGP